MLSLNFDWTIHPNSRIAKIRPAFAQKLFLIIRNCIVWAKVAMRYKRLSLNRVPEELRLAVEYLRSAGVEGDIAEFGSHQRSSGTICKEVAGLKMKTIVHLFDSFEGLPESTVAEDIKSPLVRNNIWRKGASTSGATPQLLQKQMERYLPAHQIKIFPGWYKNTLSQIPGNALFGLIHIDCDLYESTYEVLDYLFGHKMIAEGCLILFDDWNSNRASPNHGERKAWRDVCAKYGIEFTDSGTYSWDGHKVHVHSYK